jgi:acyl dehydratase
MTKYLEDFREGEIWRSGSVVIGEDEIIAYAKGNDPQPIHMDPEAARGGPFGGIIASGWQIAALSMKLFMEAGGHGDRPIVGIGIVEVRRSATKPDRGVIRTRVTVLNQRDETVMTYYALGQVRARN